jgi:hypothetical protein
MWIRIQWLDNPLHADFTPRIVEGKPEISKAFSYDFD